MFEGFSQETIDFMWGIRFNNERGWFQEHKVQYQRAFLEPMRALGGEVQADLAQRFPERRMNLKVSRIYRDARWLFGRGPYKDHLWFSLFCGDDQSSEGARPVLWFELTPDGWSRGMGFWCARPVTMVKHRARIHRDPAPLLALECALAGQDTFALEGPDYQKLSHPCPCPALDAWYRKKSLTVGAEESLTELLFSPALKDRLVEDFSFLMPFYDYFSTLWAEPDPREGHR